MESIRTMSLGGGEEGSCGGRPTDRPPFVINHYSFWRSNGVLECSSSLRCDRRGRISLDPYTLQIRKVRRYIKCLKCNSTNYLLEKVNSPDVLVL